MATQKQRKAVEAVIANAKSDQPRPMGEILEKTGYAPGVVKNPQQVVQSQGFQELMQEYLPDKDVLEQHRNLLFAGDDWNAVKNGIDMAYKLKGAYAPDKSVSVQLRADVKEMGKYQELTAEFEQKLLTQYQDEYHP